MRQSRGLSLVLVAALGGDFALGADPAPVDAGTRAHGGERPPFYRPPEGFVPDRETAIAIAVAVWSPLYGREVIAREAPFQATLVGDVWHASGTLPALQPGGVAEIEISRGDGRILRLTHGK